MTQVALAACPLVTPLPDGFDNFDTMLAVADTCQAYLQSAWICSVEYDPDYGHPKAITHYSPTALHPIDSITVQDFSVINP